MKALLTAGNNTFITFPQVPESFGFENWGNSLSVFCDDVVYLPSAVLFSGWQSFANKVEVILIELSDQRLEMIVQYQEEIRKPSTGMRRTSSWLP